MGEGGERGEEREGGNLHVIIQVIEIAYGGDFREGEGVVLHPVRGRVIVQVVELQLADDHRLVACVHEGGHEGHDGDVLDVERLRGLLVDDVLHVVHVISTSL
jgi:hypothetical protein